MRKISMFFVLALLCCVNVIAHDFEVDGIYYNKLGGDSIAVTYRGSFDIEYINEYAGEVVIPATVTYQSTTYRVTSIGSEAFNYCSGLTSVTIGNCVTVIEESAFYGCSGLTVITIPNSVTSIGENAFEGCTGLTKVNYTGTIAEWCKITFDSNDSNPTYHTHNLFINDVEVKEIVINNDDITQIKSRRNLSYIPSLSITFNESVENIPDNFCNGMTNLESVTIDASVTEIGYQAFYGCSNLTSVFIPKSVITIGSQAFSNCPALASLEVDTKNPLYRSQGNCIITKRTKELLVGCKNSVIPTDGSVTSIADYAFYGAGLTSIVIPDNITSIGNHVFAYCGSLTSVTIPNSISVIGNSMFESCSSLVSITIPNSITTIGERTFWECTNLSSITIPQSIRVIEDYAFAGCTGLTKTNYTGTIANWCEIIFSTWLSNPIVYSKNLYLNDVEVKDLVIPENVSYIREFAFNGCNSLKTVTFPLSIKEIYGFNECTNLSIVKIKSATPPRLASTFPLTATIVVPCGSSEAYWSAANWSDYPYYEEEMLYDFVVESANEAYGVVEVEQEPTCSQPAIIKALPNANYQFVKWNDGNTDNPRTINVTNHATYTAEFKAPEYTITVASEDETHGTVSGGGTAAYNSTRTIKATAKTGYEFVEWNDGNTDNPRTITVTRDSTFTAKFKTMEYTITVASNNAAYGTASGGGKYAYNSTQTITATANTGYEFVRWSDGNTDNPRTITVKGNTTYTARFEPKEYSIRVYSNNDAYGTVSGIGVYKYNQTATLRATANAGYEFTGWSDGNTENPRTITVTGEKYLTAIFEPISYTLTVASSNAAYGTVSGGGIYFHNQTATLTATANAGYEFTGWSDGNAENPRTITVTSDMNLEAMFAAREYTVSVSANNATMGMASGDGVYLYNQTATLTATAFSGYKFVQWSDGNAENPRTITVTSDVNLTANFTVAATIDDGLAYVDLGLPSGTLWAKCNVGANAPEEYGNYFAWGETEPKEIYNWNTYSLCNGSNSTMTKYCTNSSYGTVDNKKVLDPEDDAATVNLGNNWRMPTSAEKDELRMECDWQWTDNYNNTGVAGCIVSSTINGNSIFLPAAGCRYESSTDNAGSFGYYSCSSLITSLCYYADNIFFTEGGLQWSNTGMRSYGQSVRPVQTAGATTALETPEIIDGIYTQDGGIYGAEDLQIYNLVGQEVTHLNGQLQGIYLVKVGDKVQKVFVR